MASKILEQIQTKEDEIARTQKNKATNYHVGQLKAQVAKLKRELLSIATGGSGGGGANKGEGFDVSKTGDARIGFVGFPSVGKSTLLNTLTNTVSEVASYEFTTLTCIPGVMRYKGAKIQLLDLPGIIEGAKEGRGRGRQVISTARTCNIILIVLDAAKPLTHKSVIERELEGFGIRLNKTPKKISVKKKNSGGVFITSKVVQPELDEEAIKGVLREYKITSGHVMLGEVITLDDFVDALEGERVVYCPCLYVLNKIDQITIEELDLLDRIDNVVPISAMHKWNLDELVENIYETLDLIRIYTKPRGEIADFEEPVILKRKNSKVSTLCNRIHKGMLNNFRYAWVWGRSVRHQPQKVGKDHVLLDEDIVQIVKK